MPNQVGCLPFFPVMPHNHSSPGQGGQLDETSWGNRLKEMYFYIRAVEALRHTNDSEKYTIEDSPYLLKEIQITGFVNNNRYFYLPGYSANIRIKFDIRTSNGAYTASAGVYLNNTLKGTIQTTNSTTYITTTQDLDLGQITVGDKIQLKGAISNLLAYCYIRNFRLYFQTDFLYFKNIVFDTGSHWVRPSSIGLNYSPFIFTNTLV